MPNAGDSVEVDGFRLTALDVRGRRIGRVRIEPTGRPDDDEDGDGEATAAGAGVGASAPATARRVRSGPPTRRAAVS